MTLEEYRKRYKAARVRSNAPVLTKGRAKGRAVRQANADARARAYIERWLAGETHQEIADSLGISQPCITNAITSYRKRHPDTPIPRGPKKQEGF